MIGVCDISVLHVCSDCGYRLNLQLKSGADSWGRFPSVVTPAEVSQVALKFGQVRRSLHRTTWCQVGHFG